MTQFALFAGMTYYPYGGWRDFKGAHPSLPEAIKAAACTSCDWWHIADLVSGEVIEHGFRD